VCVDRESNRDVSQLACRFHLDEFSRQDCGEDNDFGYADGKPCVVVYLNRVGPYRTQPALLYPPRFHTVSSLLS